jgi:hypothetical protein
MRLSKTKGSGSTNAGAKEMPGQARRPPKLSKSGKVANDVYPDKPRSAIMPPPTKDTNFRKGR